MDKKKALKDKLKRICLACARSQDVSASRLRNRLVTPFLFHQEIP